MNPRASLPALALAALASGCTVENTASMQPHSVCSMPDDCTFSSTCDAQYIGDLKLDVSGGVPMWLAVEMHNQLANNADEELGRVNTHDAHFESYSLSYSSPVPGVDPATLTGIPSSGGRTQQIIPAGGSSVVGFEAFPIGVVAALQAAGPAVGPDYDEFVVKVTFKGRYEDGSEWEAPFKVAVRVCQDCVFAACSDPTQLLAGACPTVFQLPQGKPICVTPP